MQSKKKTPPNSGREIRLVVIRGKGWGPGGRELEEVMERYRLLYYKMNQY